MLLLGNYRESRYFTAYIPYNNNQNNKTNHDEFLLPIEFQNKFQQKTAPFGIHYLSCYDHVTIGYESCEELWTPFATHINLSLHGVDIICNSSASHHVLRKLNTRLDLIINATKKCGGIYMYSNQIGCDGNRVYYDGCALIVCNGIVLAQGSQFSIQDVEVITATIDLNDVRSYRASLPSLGIQSQFMQQQPNHKLSYISIPKGGSESFVSSNNAMISLSSKYQPYSITKPINHGQVRIHDPEEECCLGPACWLWDYLRRSGATGFFLPLSGGADSSSVAAIVSVMCHLVTTTIQVNPNGTTAQEVRRIVGTKILNDDKNKQWIPNSSQELCQHILHTTYMGTTNSSDITKSRAKRLSDAIGSYHLSITIDTIVSSILSVFSLITGKVPQFVIHGGSTVEDLALQNIQARIRMVLSYLFAQLLPWTRGKQGFLLVLSSSNVDEGLRGYMTKYDCSSGDLNPIGAISKVDLKKMLLYMSNKYPALHDILNEIATAPPTAELRPIVNNTTTTDHDEEGNDSINDSAKDTKPTAEHSQLDEEEMGMTYEELGVFGTLRKLSRCGPVSMYVSKILVFSS
jgi:NAD+ synthase (glutamine-hydrolysing)